MQPPTSLLPRCPTRRRQISKLGANDDPAAQTPEQQLLRRTLERDRYGLVAQVLVARDHCSETDCEAFRLFSDTTQIRNNMHDRLYDTTINRYAAAWSGGKCGAGRRHDRAGHADDAGPDRPANHDRFPERSLDPAGQYHELGAYHRSCAGCAGGAQAFVAAGGQRAGSACAATRGKEAGGGERVGVLAEAASDHAAAGGEACARIGTCTGR